MTAPARAGGVPTNPAKGPRERALRAVPERPARPRSGAAEKAYARKAQRTGRRPEQVRKPAPVHKAPFVVMVMMVLGVGIAAIMWLSTQATEDSYRLQEARAEETELARKVEQLRREVAQAESPLTLSEAARGLGMVPANDPARLRQLPDGSVQVYGTPSAAPLPAPTTVSPPPSAQQDAQAQQNGTAQGQEGQQGQGQQDPAQQGQNQQGQAQQNQTEQGQAQQGQPQPNAQDGQQGQQTGEQQGQQQPPG
ncbi:MULTISPECIES: hypothetical protein [Actinosynnema]|uniref:hypothetical protein n=1 Tax=Actinosynnema TaxID=40566 RepID=UPI0020A2EBFD|nr:hypothetical protein [Actinosynnema pretiosum]MCP2094118.1 hypothetical protein [Actinosynnema pretiosum]